MSIRVMTAAWAANLPAGEKLVLLALADCANDEGRCYPGIRSLCRKTGKSERSLQGAIKALCDTGHLTRDEVAGKGCNYVVHPRSSCAPAESAPPQKTTQTPAKSAGKPSGTVITKKDKPSSRARAKLKHSLPDDWQPKELTSGSICAQIVATWQPGRIERELSKFRDHHLKSDAQWSDWDAAWRTWIQRASEFERGDNGQQRTNGMGRHQSADGLSQTTRASLAVFGVPGAGEQRRLPR